MELRILTEPQRGADYETLLRFASAAEELGFAGFFRSDHFLRVAPGSALPGPTDAWTTLAGLARETRRIRLGTLMTAATFRHPGVLAVQVAQVDAMSGGRVELGLGAGWFEREHQAYGIPFPPDRFDRLAEQLEIITGLWRTGVGDTYSYQGRHYRLTECPALPKPAQRHLPIVVGGRGTDRTPRLAARYADEFNLPFAAPEHCARQFARVRQATAAAGRNPGDLAFSAAVVTCVGRDSAEAARRAAAVGRKPAEVAETGLFGAPDEVVARVEEYAAAGADRLYLQMLDLQDTAHLELIAATVLPRVGGAGTAVRGGTTSDR